MESFHIVSLMHLKREDRHYHLIREQGTEEYVFIHFISTVKIFIDGRWFEAEPDACIIFTPGQYQEYCANNQILVNNFIHFYFSSTVDWYRYNLPFNKLFYTAIGNTVTNTVELLAWNYITKPKDYLNIIDNKMHELFVILGESIKEEKYPAKRSVQREKNLNYLRGEIYRDPNGWTVERMAEFACYSRSRFSVVYTELFGNSPKKDLMESAIQKSKRLLLSTEMMVSDIAFECGFDSVEYFIRLFKKVEGTTPGAFRKNHPKK